MRAEVDGREVWVISIPFSKGFFMKPVMETTWILVVAKDDYSIQSLEFAPAPAFARRFAGRGSLPDSQTEGD